MPQSLEATCGFLRQIPNLDDKHPIEVPPGLLQVLDDAATEAKQELESKSAKSSRESCMLTYTASS